MDKEILRKIEVGDGLTDAELTEAIVFFTQMEAGLSLLGPRFHFQWVYCAHTLDALRGFQRSRERS